MILQAILSALARILGAVRRFDVMIEGALQLLRIFLASWTMDAGGYAEFCRSAVRAFGLDWNISQPFGDA